jgi:serine/threonine protein kinase
MSHRERIKKKDAYETFTVGLSYQVNTKDKLGSGGFGKVYKGFDSSSGIFVAIKQIPLDKHKQKVLHEVKNEIDLLKQLSHHRIVRYFDHAEQDNSLFIVMELVEQGSLAHLVRGFKVPEYLVGYYTAQVLEGLQYLHAEGIIHRDIKGDNILIDNASGVKLADFGMKF